MIPTPFCSMAPAYRKTMADFSEKALENVRTKDLGEIGGLLTDVVTELKDFDEEESKGIFGFLRR